VIVDDDARLTGRGHGDRRGISSRRNGSRPRRVRAKNLAMMAVNAPAHQLPLALADDSACDRPESGTSETGRSTHGQALRRYNLDRLERLAQAVERPDSRTKEQTAAPEVTRQSVTIRLGDPPSDGTDHRPFHHQRARGFEKSTVRWGQAKSWRT